jgi:hypothetical protein
MKEMGGEKKATSTYSSTAIMHDANQPLMQAATGIRFYPKKPAVRGIIKRQFPCICFVKQLCRTNAPFKKVY